MHFEVDIFQRMEQNIACQDEVHMLYQVSKTFYLHRDYFEHMFAKLTTPKNAMLRDTGSFSELSILRWNNIFLI